MIEFPFTSLDSKKFGAVLLPIIPVTIKSAAKSIKASMLLDSGAALSLMPFSVGKAISLELNIENRGEVWGIGESSVPYILSEIMIKIGDIETSIRAGWALTDEVLLILGRLDVFQQFSIEFREFENKIILKHQSEFAASL